jgi:glycosyltransferase involved in cell wall biosynthesis
LTLVSGDLWAGAETMACNLLRRLKEYDDLDLRVIVLNQGRLCEEVRAMGLKVHLVDENLNSFWEIFQKTRQITCGRVPDIIHSHRYKENLLALLISRCCPGTRLVSTQHGLPESQDDKAGVMLRTKTLINFRMLSRFFTTVSVSQDIRSILISRFGFRKEGVESIHNGIELPQLPPASAKKPGPLVIGSAGRLFPVKDYPLMVEIARSIAASGKAGVRFELAGDGPELQALEALIQRYRLNASFIIKGHQDDMDNFYRGLDIYLNTSLHEGIPMTILEALAHGVPVIAPAVGGIAEILDDGKEGYLLQGRSPDDFAAKCLLLINDPEQRKRTARAAREKAERAFSAEAMAESYRRVYRRMART